eukprot:5831807-Pyramimonas_sp.AAC.1
MKTARQGWASVPRWSGCRPLRSRFPIVGGRRLVPGRPSRGIGFEALWLGASLCRRDCLVR